MVITTRKQREALRRIYNRVDLFVNSQGRATSYDTGRPLSYREFRKDHVSPTFGCDNAIVADWCGICVCIETDGYAHS